MDAVVVLTGTVLVADDDADIVRFVEVNLRLEGFQVVTARDGQEALTKALDLQPDVILLDVLMPRIDGYTVCARLRADHPATRGERCGPDLPGARRRRGA